MKKIKISLENPEIRAIWETALEARREVASWPAWKRGEDVAPSSDDPQAPTPAASESERNR
jgi:hypothetical protein